MKTMLVLVFVFSMLAIFKINSPAYAQVNITPEICSRSYPQGQEPSVCKEISASEGKNTIYGKDGVLTKVINYTSVLVGILAVAVIIIAGIKMTLSEGDPGKVTKSRNQIIYALIGVVVVILAQSIVRLVLHRVK